MVTLKEVAEQAGVSLSVVSAVVNGSTYVRMSEATRRTVEAAVAELGYRPNAAARSLRTSRTNVIALLLPGVDNPVFAPLRRGAHAEAESIGYSLMVGDAMLLTPESHALQHLVTRGVADGLLVRTQSLRGGVEELAEIERGGIPILLLDNFLQDTDAAWISVEDAVGIELAVEALRAAGHRRIALIGGQDGGRVAAFQRAVDERGLDGVIVPPDGFRAEHGYDAMHEVWRLDTRPTAVLANNVTVARGAVAAITDLGIAVPDELSIIAYHESDEAQFYRPSVSTVHMPMEALGRRAVRAMKAMIDGEHVESGFVTEPAPRIIDRGSVGPPRA